MKYYRPRPAGDPEWLTCPREGDCFTLLALDGTPRGGSWREITVELGPADEQSRGDRVDFPCNGSGPLVMRQSVVDVLRDILETNGELLPLRTEDGETLFVLNARAIAALDEDASKIERVTRNVWDVRKYVLKGEMLEGVHVFLLPDPGGATFVSEDFVIRAREAGLTGLDFEEVEVSRSCAT